MTKFFLMFISLLAISSIQAKTQQKIRYEFQREDFIFDLFPKSPTSVGKGGKLYRLTEAQWPTLSQQRDEDSTSMGLTQLDACGISAIHYHPRAAEILYVIEGKEILTGFVEEDGGRSVFNKISKGMLTLFPEGLIHFQQNLGCEPVLMASGFSNKDPGVIQVALNSFKFPIEVIAGSYGMTEEYVEQIKAKGIPFTPVQGQHECLRRCKSYKYEEKPKNEEKPRYESVEPEPKSGYNYKSKYEDMPTYEEGNEKHRNDEKQ